MVSKLQEEPHADAAGSDISERDAEVQVDRRRVFHNA